jgi:hypothetical protein
MHIHNNDITPERPLRTIYDILSLTISTLLTTDTILCNERKLLFPYDDFRFLFHRKSYNPLLLQCPPLPHIKSCKPTKCDSYLANSLATVVSEPDLLRALNIPFTKCHISFPLLRSYQRSVQARGTCIRFVPKPVFTMRGC